MHGSINDAYTYLDEGKRFANRSPENMRGENISVTHKPSGIWRASNYVIKLELL